MKNYDNYKKHLKIIKQETSNEAYRIITEYSRMGMFQKYNFIDDVFTENDIEKLHELHNKTNESIKALSENLFKVELELIGNEEKFKETINIYDKILNSILSKNNYQFKLKKEKLIFGDIAYNLSNDIINIELNNQRLSIKSNNVSMHLSYNTDIFIDKFKITESEYSNCELLNNFSKDLDSNKLFFKELVSNIAFLKDFFKLNDKFIWEENKKLNLFNIKEGLEILVLEHDLNLPIDKKIKNGKTKWKQTI